jgi:hypothetical protein
MVRSEAGSSSHLEDYREAGVPVSHWCPRCAHATAFERRKPNRLIAFTADRVCKVCGTRYAPPTPPWAGALLGFIGLSIVGVGLLAMATLGWSLAFVIALLVAAVFRCFAPSRAEGQRPAWTFLPALGAVTVVLLLTELGRLTPDPPAGEARPRLSELQPGAGHGPGPGKPPHHLGADAGAGREGKAEPPVFLIAVVVCLALAWLWTAVGVLGLWVVAYGIQSLMQPAPSLEAGHAGIEDPGQ